MITQLKPQIIAQAHQRISPYIKRTPLLSSSQLNEYLGHDVIFKCEMFQKIGAFKFRGAINTLLALKEQDQLPSEVVAFSSGNHAQGVALAANLLGIKSTILMNHSASLIKQQATRAYGAKVVNVTNRAEAEEIAAEMESSGAYLIHPFDNDMVIAGQGTACFEALQDMKIPNAIFAPCGGGGLMSGTLLATKLLAPDAKVFAGEPLSANDATQSYQLGKIVRLTNTPNTIADGVMTPSVSERTLHYLKQLNGFYEVMEEEIVYWTQWLQHLLKIVVEPSSAIAMAAAYKWLTTKKGRQRVLVVLSGGNISPETYRAIWQSNYLDKIPNQSLQNTHYTI